MNDARTLRDVATLCGSGDVHSLWTLPMLRRMSRLSKPELKLAKRLIKQRFGKDCAPQLMARAIKQEREKFLRSERARVFKEKSDSSSDRKLLPAKRPDALMAEFGRRGGMWRGRKGLAAMNPETYARVKALALAGTKRAAAERRAARGESDE